MSSHHQHPASGSVGVCDRYETSEIALFEKVCVLSLAIIQRRTIFKGFNIFRTIFKRALIEILRRFKDFLSEGWLRDSLRRPACPFNTLINMRTKL